MLARIGEDVVDEILDLCLWSSFDQKIDWPDQRVSSGGNCLIGAFLSVDSRGLDLRVQKAVGEVADSIGVVCDSLADGAVGILDQSVLCKRDIRDDLLER